MKIVIRAGFHRKFKSSEYAFVVGSPTIFRRGHRQEPSKADAQVVIAAESANGGSVCALQARSSSIHRCTGACGYCGSKSALKDCVGRGGNCSVPGGK